MCLASHVLRREAGRDDIIGIAIGATAIQDGQQAASAETVDRIQFGGLGDHGSAFADKAEPRAAIAPGDQRLQQPAGARSSAAKTASPAPIPDQSVARPRSAENIAMQTTA